MKLGRMRNSWAKRNKLSQLSWSFLWQHETCSWQRSANGDLKVSWLIFQNVWFDLFPLNVFCFLLLWTCWPRQPLFWWLPGFQQDCPGICFPKQEVWTYFSLAYTREGDQGFRDVPFQDDWGTARSAPKETQEAPDWGKVWDLRIGLWLAFMSATSMKHVSCRSPPMVQCSCGVNQLHVFVFALFVRLAGALVDEVVTQVPNSEQVLQQQPLVQAAIFLLNVVDVKKYGKWLH